MDRGHKSLLIRIIFRLRRGAWYSGCRIIKIGIMTIRQKKKYLFLAFISVLLFNLSTYAQYTQTIRGRVADQLLEKPLEGATVSIPAMGVSTITKPDGSFRIENVPL